MSTFIDGSLDPARAYHLLRMQDFAQRGLADHWPHARWIKFLPDGDHILVMVCMNKACADRFYHGDGWRMIGHCDRAAWSDEYAAHYAKTDREAIARAGEMVECLEPVQGNGNVRVRKFAYRIDNEEVKGWFVYGECPD